MNFLLSTFDVELRRYFMEADETCQQLEGCMAEVYLITEFPSPDPTPCEEESTSQGCLLISPCATGVHMRINK